MTKIKICGLMRQEDIQAVNSAKPDYIGFVFAPYSKRYITPKMALSLRDNLDSNIQVVGVFVDAPILNIVELVEMGIIDIIQLHGSEDEAYVSQLRGKVTVPIIQAFKVMGRKDIVKANASRAEMVLLDSGAGTGEIFDWSLLSEVTRPFILAGGLDYENVQEAITSVRPYGVDTSSGVEVKGRKDSIKIAMFVNKVREQ